MNFAVIGAGITGLSAAWLLSKKHQVTLYEAEGRLGGHANTVDVAAREGRCPIDTGFIVYNTGCYPNLIALFEHLRVPTAPTDMGFSVSLDGGSYEYSGSTVASLFGQWSNLASPVHWRMVADILRFFREADATSMDDLDPDVTLGQWLDARNYSRAFIDRHIVPMGAAIWSTPAAKMMGFPFAAFARFFANHGLLKTHARPPWRTVKGGSREYVARIAAELNGPIVADDPVVSVSPQASGGVEVRTAGGRIVIHDAVLIACHADDARSISNVDDAAVLTTLSAFRYAQNSALLHSDARLMPQRRRVWAAWNYIAAASDTGNDPEPICLTYWMNKLQPLRTKTDYFVTLNPTVPPAEKHILGRYPYRHPMFDASAMAAQMKLWPLQGRNGIWYAGSYFGYGFHEDGIQSGLAAAEDMSERIGGGEGRVARPWTWDLAQSRLQAWPAASNAVTSRASA